jgi:hypothetical protein
MKKLFLLLWILACVAYVYAGMPMHVGTTPRFHEPSQVFTAQPWVREMFRGFAQALTYVGLPAGRVADAPILVHKQELGLFDAAVNLFATFACSTVMTLFFVFAGLMGIVDGIIQLSLWSVLKGVGFLVFGPVVCSLVVPFVATTSLVYEESSWGYWALFFPFLIVGWGLLLGLLFGAFMFIAAVIDGSGGSGAPRSSGASGGAVDLPAGTRVHPKTGVVQKLGFLGLGWRDTGERIHPKTGIVQKITLFGWRDK